jgi:nicotinic acid phosphoribosyltransferase
MRVDDQDEDDEGPEDQLPIPMPPVARKVTYEYTHEDLVVAADRAIKLLEPILDEDIYKGLMRVQFDVDDVVALLKNFKNRVAIHAFQSGKLVWQNDILPHVDETIDLGKLLKKD